MDSIGWLAEVEDEKDIGVLFSSTLNYSHHVNEIVYKANRKARLLGINKRTFDFLEPQCCATSTLY